MDLGFGSGIGRVLEASAVRVEGFSHVGSSHGAGLCANVLHVIRVLLSVVKCTTLEQVWLRDAERWPALRTDVFSHLKRTTLVGVAFNDCAQQEQHRQCGFAAV